MAQIKLGPDGKIVESILSPEEASRIGKLGGEALKRKHSKERHQEAVDLLESLTGLPWDECPEEQRQLAEKYTLKGDASTMTLLLKQTGRLAKAEPTNAGGMPDWDPESGDPCPLCGGVRVTIALDDESAVCLAGVLNASDLEDGAPGPVEGRKGGNGRGAGVPA